MISMAKNVDIDIPGLSDCDVTKLTKLNLSAKSKARNLNQDQKRAQYFLKGPLSFNLIRQIIPDSTSRVILIAKAFADMARESNCVLSKKIWACAGVKEPSQRRRILARLREMSPNLVVQDRRGRPSILNFLI
jgi:hypothetical protein